MYFFIRSVLFGLMLGAFLLIALPVIRDISFNGTYTNTNGENKRLSFYHAIAKAAPAVVNIYSTHNEIFRSRYKTQTLERTSLGSGVIMDRNGYILTCYHVIKDAEQIILGLQDGRFVQAQLVGFDPYTDLAVLHSNAPGLQVIPQLDNPSPQLGDVVLAIGNPYNLGQTTTRGIISATGRAGWGSYIGNQNYADFIQTDVVLNDGNSGGALIDSNGVLMGINNANFKTLDDKRQVKDVAGVSFAVPYTLAKRVMDSIVQDGRVIRGYLGIGVQSRLDNSPLIINSITPNSPAYHAGLEVNDIIVQVDGQTITSEQALVQWVAESSPGSQIEVEIIRKSKKIRLPIIIGELKG